MKITTQLEQFQNPKESILVFKRFIKQLTKNNTVIIMHAYYSVLLIGQLSYSDTYHREKKESATLTFLHYFVTMTSRFCNKSTSLIQILGSNYVP